MRCSDWPTELLGDLAEFRNGVNFTSASFGMGAKMIGVGDFHDRLKPCYDELSEIDPTGVVSARAALEHGDIVFVRSNGNRQLIGRSMYVDRPPEYLIHSAFTIRCRFTSKAVEPIFYAYLFRTPLVRDALTAFGGGTNISNLNQDILGALKVPVPPLAKQRRIASILSAYDDLIENCQRRIRILEDMARGLYREWFVHFRFPGAESLPRVDSPLGPIPQGWEVGPLADVAVVNAAQINPRNAPDEIGYIDIASVSPGRVEATTSYRFADAPGRARRVVRHGDVLWSCVRPNRRSHALVLNPGPNTVASTGFAVLTSRAVPFTYLYHATTTDEFVAYLTNHATGAAYPAVTARTFENAALIVPHVGVLARFAEATVPMAMQARQLEAKIANLRRTRDLLLPRLLSGQFDLRASEEAEPA